MPSSNARSRRRRGRPPESERAQRRDQALDAALLEIVESGYERVTMTAVAARAGSSKESLYSWFGSKEAMVAALIRRQSARTNAGVEHALATDLPPREVLVGIATNLLDLLLGDVSLALNRAAMASPALAAVLLQEGRHTTGRIVEHYLARLRDEGVLRSNDPAETFQLFYGLVIRDTQIRALLHESQPDAAGSPDRAREAVDRFLKLAGVPDQD